MKVQIIGFEESLGNRIGTLLRQKFQAHPLVSGYCVDIALVVGYSSGPSIEIGRALSEPHVLINDVKSLIDYVLASQLRGVELVGEVARLSLRRRPTVHVKSKIGSKTWRRFKKPSKPKCRQSHPLC